EDDWHDNYIGAPTDGSAWFIKNDNRSHRKCPRGGSWYNYPNYCRSAYRFNFLRRDLNRYNYGFRVVCVAGRTL
ncbi:MAG: formylglycine-generating enzyme family protein, partial [Microcystis aeruginosa]